MKNNSFETVDLAQVEHRVDIALEPFFGEAITPKTLYEITTVVNKVLEECDLGSLFEACISEDPKTPGNLIIVYRQRYGR
jgi:hypothetical protein